MRSSLLSILLIMLWTLTAGTASAQGHNDLLTRMVHDRAAAFAEALQLNEQQAAFMTRLLLQEAEQREQLIVSADPDVSVLEEIRRIGENRDRALEALLDKEQFDLYEHMMEQEAERRAGEFDSLQILLTVDSFRMESQAYFDEMVAPYLLYYHQTFFQPALKEKHVWRINQARLDLELFYYGVEDVPDDSVEVADGEELTLREAEDRLNLLKKIRRRYRDELDYISVALSPVERQWTADYIDLVQRHYPDDVYERVKAHTYELHAYGTQYITGQMALILMDAWNPSGFLDHRDMLIELYSRFDH